MAVISNKETLLTLLLELGLDPSTAKCSPPLHLACFLGHLPLVQTLMLHGANPNQEAGMCYPKSHAPVRHVPSRFHFLETDIFLCDGIGKPPLLYAIQNDHIEIVKMLISKETEWPLHQYPLHYACQFGSFHSVKYLTKLKTSELNATDLHAMTTLHYGVNWGKDFVQYLVEAGVNVHRKTKTNKTALHLLFANTQIPADIFETTKYLLGMGLEQDISLVDENQNSALHELITHVNYKVGNYTKTNINQGDYDSEIINTLDLMAKHNCEMNQVNNSGLTPLHKLLITFEFVASNEQIGETLEMLPAHEKYKVDFTVLYKALQILLHHGADPNLTTCAGRSAFHIILHTALNIDPQKLIENKQCYFECISLLCSNGAQPSCTLAVHKTTAAILTELGRHSLALSDEYIRKSRSEFVKDLLSLLARNGLNCNHKTSLGVKISENVSGCGNVLVDMVRLAQFIHQPSDLKYIYTWVLTLMQLGANPDIEPYQSDPIICHSQSSIFLKSKNTQAVNQYMYEIQDLRQLLEGGHAQRLLLLFYNSMQHEALFQSMNSAKFMSRFDPNRIPSSHFVKMLNSLVCHPRSLQQIARVAIYVAIDRQLLLRVPQLPIPKRLQHYLINIE